MIFQRPKTHFPMWQMANNVARPPSKLITTKKRGVVSKILMTSSRETAVKKEQNGQFVHFQKRTVIRAQKGRKRAPTSYFGDNFSSASSYTYRSAAPFFRFSNHLKNKNGTKYFLQSVLLVLEARIIIVWSSSEKGSVNVSHFVSIHALNQRNFFCASKYHNFFVSRF